MGITRIAVTMTALLICAASATSQSRQTNTTPVTPAQGALPPSTRTPELPARATREVSGPLYCFDDFEGKLGVCGVTLGLCNQFRNEQLKATTFHRAGGLEKHGLTREQAVRAAAEDAIKRFPECGVVANAACFRFTKIVTGDGADMCFTSPTFCDENLEEMRRDGDFRVDAAQCAIVRVR